MWICLHMNDGLSQEARKSANMDGEVSHLHGWGGHPIAVKGLAEVRTHGVKVLGRVGFGRQ